METKRLKQKMLLLLVLGGCSLSASAQIGLTFNLGSRGDIITDDHYGIFYEEINHAGDGGLYAELVRNRSFEEDMNSPICWSTLGNSEMSLTSDEMLNTVQQRALRVNIKSAGAGIRNEGYWGINIVSGREYELSFWLRAEENYNGKITAELQNSGQQNMGRAIISINATREWKKYTTKIRATGTDGRGFLALKGSKSGVIVLDVVSLFPPTFKGRKNGCRPDLAQMLADMHPRFMRFPGGCYIEGAYGDGKTNRFEWKKTIGPIEERPGHMNRNWWYKVTDGQGYHEYLELAEDLGANAMFVVNIGIGHDWKLDENDIDPFIQEALDAIEYANGSTETFYGRLRAQNGHPEPFNLKYMEIGNEQEFMLSRDDYMRRYMQFYNAIKKQWPDIHLIADSYWFDAITEPVELKDEHYYDSPEFFISQYNRYDNQAKSGTKVYVGEYAVTKNYGVLGNMNAAIGEAVFMQGCENNSEAVTMMSYAPIFTHEDNFNWRPDMIRFNSSMSYGTPSYYVQKLFSNNTGKQNIHWTENNNAPAFDPNKGTVGIGTWLTSATFTGLTIKTGNTTINTAGTQAADWSTTRGSWTISPAEDSYQQTSTSDADVRCILQGEYNTTDVDMTVKATKQGGSEGFLIIFNYINEQNYAWLNLGGWGNSKHAVEQCMNGKKTLVGEKEGSLKKGQEYTIRVLKEGQHVRCYIDGELIIDTKLSKYADRLVYTSASIDDSDGTLYIKIVNPTSDAKDISISLTGGHAVRAEAEVLSATNGTDENSTANPRFIVPRTTTLSVNDDGSVPYSSPAYSVGVLRLTAEDIQQPTSEPLPDPVLSFSFEDGTPTDDSGTHTGQLMGKASIVTLDDGNHVLFAGGLGDGGYLSIPVAAAQKALSNVTDYTISINLLQRVGNNTGRFCWAWSMERGTDQYLGLINGAGNGDWYYEIKNGSTQNAHSYAGLSIGDWHNITYTQQNNIGRIYIDGHLRREVSVTIKPSAFIKNITRFYIGHSPFGGDAIMENTLFDDFIIYDQALTPEQVSEIGRKATAMHYSGRYESTAAQVQELKSLVNEVKNYVYETADDNLINTYDKAVKALNGTNTAAQVKFYENLSSAVAAYQQTQLNLAAEGHAADLTFLITNSSFTRYNIGWQGAHLSSNYAGYDRETAEQFSRGFDVWQEISGLPAGIYSLTCSAFYRAGNINTAYDAWQNSDPSIHNAQLYLNSESVSLTNIYSSTAYTREPYTFPDNLAQASEALNGKGGYAEPEVRTQLNEGEQLRFGIRKLQTIPSDWVVYDRFRLRYLGKADGIAPIHSEECIINNCAGSVFDLSGRRTSLSYVLPKGIYIANGSKIIIK